MTRLAVVADIHADDYAGIPGRFDDILGTVRWVGRKARELGCEVLVVAGDYTPEKVCHWLFEVAGLEPEDELVDLFPGTGAVTRAWEAWRSQLRLQTA